MSNPSPNGSATDDPVPKDHVAFVLDGNAFLPKLLTFQRLITLKWKFHNVILLLDPGQGIVK